MAQFLGFGSGYNGAGTLSGVETPIDSGLTGTANSGTGSLNVTNPSFIAGRKIFVYQSRGTGVGGWEINQIQTYSPGSLATLLPLANTYTDDGGNSQAQIIMIPEYSTATIGGGNTYSPKAWDGNVGGVMVFIAGQATVAGTINATGRGYAGGGQVDGDNPRGAQQGEGSSGIGIYSDWQLLGHYANGNGGGGGSKDDSSTSGSGGGGGGNGGDGVAGRGEGSPGNGGVTVGSATLTTLFFGGGGGGGRNDNGSHSGVGGYGGAIVLIMAKSITVTGAIISGGNNGGGSDEKSGGGGGAGGSVLIKSQTAILGSGLITCPGGNGGTGYNGAEQDWGGDGAVGRIRAEACTLTGSTSPTLSSVIGGFSYCGSVAAILM